MYYNDMLIVWEEFLNMLFPERCISCRKQGAVLCALCERAITTKPKALSGTTAALFDYQNPLVKKATWALKYHRKKALGKYFGVALYREFFKQLAKKGTKVREEILLIPIPAGKKATTIRGYNHATVIAKSIARCAKDDGLVLTVCDTVLYKKFENPQQVKTQGRKGRKANVEQLFGVEHGEKLAGKTLILIDDVITTGATMSEAKRALREFHPKRILAIAVAH
jgi:ComF family protein